VTVSDLKSVKLKTSRTPLRLKNRNANTPRKDQLDFRKSLRHVESNYSPGGTLLLRRPPPTGEGVIPTIERALRKKFEVCIITIILRVPVFIKVFIDGILCPGSRWVP
jgi:hypothetical protein